MIENFVEKNDKFVQRALEMSLGILTWGLLTSPIWLGILYPRAVVYLLTFLTVYWSYLALKHTIGLIYGYRRYADEINVDWLKECQNLDFSTLPDKETLPPSFKDLKHLFLIPAVNEPEGVFEDSLNSIFNQSFPTNQIVIAYTVEQKYADQTIERIKKVIGDRVNLLHKVLFYIHPSGIPGEAIGDGGANRAWGASHVVEDLKNMGENVRYYIYNNLDSDHVLHKEYLSRTAYLYLTSDKRDNHFYTSAVPLFENNLWKVPLMMRIEANSITLGVVSDWGTRDSAVKKTFSAFSVSLQTMIDANYWDVALGADDTVFYWRAFFAKNGEFDGKPHFIPYSADAVEGKNYIDAYRSLYKQLLRWGWGVVDFPLSLKGFLKNRQISTSRKIKWTLRHLKERVLMINIVFLITFGFGLVTLVNPYVKQSNFAYSLPDIMSTILTMTLVLLIPTTYFRRKFSGRPPKEWPIHKKIISFFEGPLIMLNLLTFSFVPWVEAQTRMLFGKRMKDLYHTPKVR